MVAAGEPGETKKTCTSLEARSRAEGVFESKGRYMSRLGIMSAVYRRPNKRCAFFGRQLQSLQMLFAFIAAALYELRSCLCVSRLEPSKHLR